ncbi:MAG: hypothetical protein ACPGJV_15150 [Bacteriovoracaceae bacterium]
MKYEKPLIFVGPLSNTLKSLKDAIAGNPSSGVEVYEIDDLKELLRAVPSLGQALILGSNAKKVAKFLQAGKKINKKKKTKVILLTQKQYPRKTVDKLMKIGLTDIINEPVPAKTLMYKVNLIIRSLEVPKKKDLEKSFAAKENDPSQKDDKKSKQTKQESFPDDTASLAEDSQDERSFAEHSEDLSSEQQDEYNFKDGQSLGKEEDDEVDYEMPSIKPQEEFDPFANSKKEKSFDEGETYSNRQNSDAKEKHLLKELEGQALGVKSKDSNEMNFDIDNQDDLYQKRLQGLEDDPDSDDATSINTTESFADTYMEGKGSTENLQDDADSLENDDNVIDTTLEGNNFQEKSLEDLEGDIQGEEAIDSNMKGDIHDLQEGDDGNLEGDVFGSEESLDNLRGDVNGENIKDGNREGDFWEDEESYKDLEGEVSLGELSGENLEGDLFGLTDEGSGPLKGDISDLEEDFNPEAKLERDDLPTGGLTGDIDSLTEDGNLKGDIFDDERNESGQLEGDIFDSNSLSDQEHSMEEDRQLDKFYKGGTHYQEEQKDDEHSLENDELRKGELLDAEAGELPSGDLNDLIADEEDHSGQDLEALQDETNLQDLDYDPDEDLSDSKQMAPRFDTDLFNSDPSDESQNNAHDTEGFGDFHSDEEQQNQEHSLEADPNFDGMQAGDITPDMPDGELSGDNFSNEADKGPNKGQTDGTDHIETHYGTNFSENRNPNRNPKMQQDYDEDIYGENPNRKKKQNPEFGHDDPFADHNNRDKEKTKRKAEEAGFDQNTHYDEEDLYDQPKKGKDFYSQLSDEDYNEQDPEKKGPKLPYELETDWSEREKSEKNHGSENDPSSSNEPNYDGPKVTKPEPINYEEFDEFNIEDLIDNESTHEEDGALDADDVDNLHSMATRLSTTPPMFETAQLLDLDEAPFEPSAKDEEVVEAPESEPLPDIENETLIGIDLLIKIAQLYQIKSLSSDEVLKETNQYLFKRLETLFLVEKLNEKKPVEIVNTIIDSNFSDHFLEADVWEKTKQELDQQMPSDEGSASIINEEEDTQSFFATKMMINNESYRLYFVTQETFEERIAPVFQTVSKVLKMIIKDLKVSAAQAGQEREKGTNVEVPGLIKRISTSYKDIFVSEKSDAGEVKKESKAKSWFKKTLEKIAS